MKCILFVDSDESGLDRLRRMLKDQRGRWELYFAPSGEAALDACACLNFHVVVTGTGRPGLDGIALLHQLRDRYPDSARLLISDKEDFLLATRASSVAYRVLSRPFTQEQLVSTIERVCVLQENFTTLAIRKAIGRIGTLPSLSRTYVALALAVQDPESSIEGVAAIVEQDIAMAAKVLQIVNSGFFGLAQAMTRILAAVTYLGIETMRNLALAADTLSVFVPHPCIPENYIETLHRRSERAAIIVGTLPLSFRDREVAVVAALLHDIGELAIASRMPFQLKAVNELATECRGTTFEAEEMLAGVSHAEVGAYLLGVWGISGQIVEAVAHHHRPQRIPHTGFDSTMAVFLAALIADELEDNPNDASGAALQAADRDSLQALGLLDQYPLFRARAVQALQIRKSA